MRKRAFVHLYTGVGGGKTTSALGVALRAVGHGKKVVIIQFMKGRKDVGEYKIRKKLGVNYEIKQFGRKEFVDYDHPSEEDIKLAREGLEYAKEKLKERPYLLILDEIALATAIGLLKPEDVLEIIRKAPSETIIIMTGRYATRELAEVSDIITEVIDTKGTKRRFPARKGYEY